MSQSILRALSVVNFFSETPRTLTEVTNHLGVHKSTALRLLQSLEEEGFARRRTDGKYTVGFAMIAIAQRALDGIELNTVAEPHLLKLSEQFGHTIHLAQLEQNEISYISKVDGPGAVKMRSRVGQAAELHTSGVAKVIIAHAEPDIQAKLLQRVTYRRYTPTTITEPVAFHRELDLIASRGWAEDNSEYEDFVGCVAAPIRNSRGQVMAGVSITALRSLVSREALKDCVPVLLESATAISRDLGWIGPTQQ